MSKINYKKAGVYYIFGNFFNKGIAFLTVPIFTRLLSVNDYGIVSTYNSWVGIISVCISFMLYMAIRQAFFDFPEKIDEFHFTMTIFIIVISMIVLSICIIIGVFFSVNITLPVLCIIQSFASAVIEDYSMYLMMKYQYRARTAIMVLPNLISVITSMIIIHNSTLNSAYLGRILPTVIVTFLFGCTAVVFVLKKSKKFNFAFLQYGLKISTPLIAHGMALTILAQSDRIMITSFVGADKTGIYSVVYNFSMVATALTTALAGIWQPWYLTRLKQHGENDFKKINEMVKVYVLFISTVMCGIILIAPEILRFLVSESYWDGIYIIPPIVLSNFIIFLYSFYVDVEHFYKRTKQIAFNTIVAGIGNIILNFVYIPLYGYQAAAYTTIVSYVLSFVAHYACAKKIEPQTTTISNYLRECFLVLIMAALYYVLIDCWYIRWGIAVILFGAVFASLLKKYGKCIKRR